MVNSAASVAAAVCVLALCAFASARECATVGPKLEWAGITAANDLIPVEANTNRFSTSVTIGGKTIPTGFNLIIRGGDKPSATSDVFGQIFDQVGKPVKTVDAAGLPQVDNEYSVYADFTGIVKGQDNKLYAITHMEDPTPSAAYLTSLAQSSDGKLTGVHTKNIDFSAVFGLWNPCAGSVTPWGTHLGSEEGPTDARVLAAATSTLTTSALSLAVTMVRYFGVYASQLTGIDHLRTLFKPYRYGFPWEVTISRLGKATVAKHYSMGRLGLELAKVMPDRRTAYLNDDGSNVVFTRYFADKAGDLSAGELFCAKWVQKTAANGGAEFDLSWISLGHATDAELTAAASTMVFSDIFEVATYAAGCPAGFSSVNAGSYGAQCLKLKAGMEKYASRFETERYSALKGCTTEFNKWEGLSFSAKRNKLYVGMTAHNGGMENIPAGKNDMGGPNDIRLPANACGCVWEISVDSSYIAYHGKPLVCGTPVDGDKYNRCSVDSLSNPDNLSVMDEYDTLIVGEDTYLRTNDILWSIDLNTLVLTRIMTGVAGSEMTSSYWYPNVNNFAYLVNVVQHPYGEYSYWNGSTILTSTLVAGNAQYSGVNHYVGYFGPLPVYKPKEHVCLPSDSDYIVSAIPWAVSPATGHDDDDDDDDDSHHHDGDDDDHHDGDDDDHHHDDADHDHDDDDDDHHEEKHDDDDDE